jgi:CheY-like chemotaxis protein
MSQGVLIADHEADRAMEISKACELRGLRTRCAAHGPAALELALADVPDLVVATDQLPMIDAGRLAEIVRSNPRTQAVPFLFLGVNPREDEASPFDEKLPHGADAEDVALRVESMLARQSRVHEVTLSEGQDHEMAGKLAQVPLADVLQLLHLNQRTGTLEVARRLPGRRQERGQITLHDGNAVQAQVGPVDGEKALFRLLGWEEGSFAFQPGRHGVTASITAPTRALLLEGARHVDEWSRARSKLPSLDAQIRLRVKSGGLPNVVQPLTQEVLLLLEIYDRVGDVVDHCTYPDYQVLRTIHTLIERDVVELRRSIEQPAEGPGLFSAPQVRRLHEWLGHESGRGHGCGEAKLLLFTSSAEATREFLERLAQLPGLEIRAAREGGPPGRGDFVPCARIGVSDDASIELLHVPAERACEPLWHLAAHRALGVVLVVRGTGAEARDLLKGSGTVLRGLPRARIFHAVLLEDVQPQEPRAIRAALGLDEGAVLAALGPGGSDLGGAALRGLLASVVP